MPGTSCCGTCGTIHNASDTRAESRFSPAGVTGFRAALPGARLRATRAAAVRDGCDARRQEA